MKQGTLVTRLIILILLVAVVIYIVVYTWRGFSDPYQMVVTYAYSMDDALSLEGAVVRTEQSIPGQSRLAEVLPQEGERVHAGASVALIYKNEDALAARRQAQSLELELEQLNYAMRRGDTVSDVKELDSQLIHGLSHLKSSVSAGELSDLEEQGLKIRNLVVKRTSDAASSAESLAQLQQTAAGLERELTALNASSVRGTQQVTVSRGGVFSGLADDLEGVLTPERLETMTAKELDKLREEGAQASTSALGKLITDSTWYYAAAIPETAAQRLEEGRRYDLSFTGDFNAEITMTLRRLGSAEEDGRCLAVFSSNRYLNQVTLCRFTGARLVFQRFNGVRVPARAIRVRENDDGTTTLGVYTLVGRRAEFKQVEIIREGEDFYLVRGADENRKVLRPGDVLILSNRELHTGKVVA